MASLSLPAADEYRGQSRAPDEPAHDAVWIAGFGNPLAADYADYLRGADKKVEVRGLDAVAWAARPCLVVDTQESDISRSFAGGGEDMGGPPRPRHLILFLKPKLAVDDRRVIDDLLAQAARPGVVARQTSNVGRALPAVDVPGGQCPSYTERFSAVAPVVSVCIISTFRVHFGDRVAGESEAWLLGRAQKLGLKTVVLRPSHVISRRSSVGTFLRRFGAAYPLVPGRLRTSFIEGSVFFAAIEKERQAAAQRHSVRTRLITLLGPNRPWKQVLKERRSGNFISPLVTALSAILSLLLLGHVVALVTGLLCKRRPAWRCANFDTLGPRSFEELLALYNPFSYRHVRVVGYNNGVNHFGHRYPGRTIISTVALNRVIRTGPEIIKADCGTTIRKARDFVSAAGQDLCVIPNYSYVALGTAFFVPIHGSASDYSCVAETITRAVLYDPIEDRIIRAAKNDPAFQRFAYNQAADVLLLRLQMRVKPKSSYYLHQEEVDAPTAGQMLAVLGDVKAANVEVRKPRASAAAAQIYRYSVQADDSKGPVMEVPRDSLGRLWDRLEENAVTSFLMHALTRHLAFHVELFFTEAQFATFWAEHRSLPLKKIQLRFIRRDGLAHSPFRDEDCVSSDMFMFRWHRRAFEEFVRRTLPQVRANPGKHSM